MDTKKKGIYDEKKDRIGGKIHAKKKMGQNFLQDDDIAKKITSSIPLDHKGPIIEIGPGLGALTGSLIERKNHITAIEMDKDLSRMLTNQYNKYIDNKLNIIQGDILKIPEILFMSSPYIISNLPYYISTEVIKILLDNTPLNRRPDELHFKGCTLMMQKELVNRLVSPNNSRNYGKISVQFQLKMDHDVLFDVLPESFFPVPGVTSTVISFKPSANRNHEIDEVVFRDLLKMCFSKRRKKLKNTINTEFFHKCIKYEDIKNIFDELDILDKRAENISPKEYVHITKKIEDNM